MLESSTHDARALSHTTMAQQISRSVFLFLSAEILIIFILSIQKQVTLNADASHHKYTNQHDYLGEIYPRKGYHDEGRRVSERRKMIGTTSNISSRRLPQSKKDLANKNAECGISNNNNLTVSRWNQNKEAASTNGEEKATRGQRLCLFIHP